MPIRLTSVARRAGSGLVVQRCALAAAASVTLVSGLAGQRIPLARPDPIMRLTGITAPGGITFQATPTQVTVAWQPVRGATTYTVERGVSPTGPWGPLGWNSAYGTQLTVPSPMAPPSAGGQGLLLYYRISAVPASGEPAVTIVPWITPSIETPVIQAWHQDHGDLVLYWTPAPGASKYVVTAVGGAGGNRYVEVDPQFTSYRLTKLTAAENQGASLTVAVNAKFEPGGIVTQGPGTTIAIAAVNSCWPLATSPGPAPMRSGQRGGVTSISVGAVGPANSGASILYERALGGSQTWETLGCLPGGTLAYDVNLQPGTSYTYRMTSVSSVAGTGQTLWNLQTDLPADTPILTAQLSGQSRVYLSWRGVAGAEGYRITSSYGYSMLVPQPANYSQAGLNALNVPAGTQVFTLTVLYPVGQPNPKPPSQATVVVPVPNPNPT